MQGDNIFVVMAGDRWLGDLGSAVAVAVLLQCTTRWCRKEKLIGQPAKARFDFYMLAVAHAADHELHKAHWQDKLVEADCCPASRFVANQGCPDRIFARYVAGYCSC